jgi:hypothetical protein
MSNVTCTCNSREVNCRLCKYKVPVLAVKARGE